MNNSLHLKQKCAHKFFNAHFLLRGANSLQREESSGKTVSLAGQIVSKDKYLSMSSHQMEAIVFISLQTFFATHAVLKIGK